MESYPIQKRIQKYTYLYFPSLSKIKNKYLFDLVYRLEIAYRIKSDIDDNFIDILGNRFTEIIYMFDMYPKQISHTEMILIIQDFISIFYRQKKFKHNKLDLDPKFETMYYPILHSSIKLLNLLEAMLILLLQTSIKHTFLRKKFWNEMNAMYFKFLLTRKVDTSVVPEDYQNLYFYPQNERELIYLIVNLARNLGIK